MKMINILLVIAIAALLIAAGYLIYYNQSGEVYSKILPVVILGLGTVIATIYFSAKETKSQETFENVVFFDGTNNTILHPEGFELPKYYDNLFSPNKSSNPEALARYPKRADSLDHDEVFDFYGYINASVLEEIFLQIREANKRLMSPDAFNISFSEDLDIPKLNIKYKHLKDLVEIDIKEFKGNFTFLPDLEEPMPEGVQIKFIATSAQASLSGAREMIIFRPDFFEYHVKAEVHQSSFGSKGYFTVRLISSVKFEKLTSQHRLTKVYKAYCQTVRDLLSTRFNDAKSFDDYSTQIRTWTYDDKL